MKTKKYITLDEYLTVAKGNVNQVKLTLKIQWPDWTYPFRYIADLFNPDNMTGTSLPWRVKLEESESSEEPKKYYLTKRMNQKRFCYVNHANIFAKEAAKKMSTHGIKVNLINTYNLI